MPCTSSSGLWLLADCNNFYASCERLFRPDLAEQAMGALELMDFEGKEAVRAYLAKHLEKEDSLWDCLDQKKKKRP